MVESKNHRHVKSIPVTNRLQLKRNKRTHNNNFHYKINNAQNCNTWVIVNYKPDRYTTIQQIRNDDELQKMRPVFLYEKITTERIKAKASCNNRKIRQCCLRYTNVFVVCSQNCKQKKCSNKCTYPINKEKGLWALG
jgi:hypothetical protein